MTDLDAALNYAAHGWPVFPCWPRHKTPITPHGHLDAVTDHQRIHQWWTRYPNANVGIRTGWPGPDVLDFDVKAGIDGLATHRRLTDAGLCRGHRWTVHTPSGGRHLFYIGTEQRCAGLWRHGLDFKACGGYVIVPPSSTVDGRYRFLTPGVGPFTTVDWSKISAFLDAARPTPPPVRSSQAADCGALIRWVAHQPEGNRNCGLYWAARRAIEAGAGADVLAALVDVAATSGLSKVEATRTVWSARRAGGAA